MTSTSSLRNEPRNTVGVVSGLVVESYFWITTFRRAFSPGKPIVQTIRFAQGE